MSEKTELVLRLITIGLYLGTAAIYGVGAVYLAFR
jgi:hypothetical protein